MSWMWFFGFLFFPLQLIKQDKYHKWTVPMCYFHNRFIKKSIMNRLAEFLSILILIMVWALRKFHDTGAHLRCLYVTDYCIYMFQVIKESGPPHMKSFVTRVSVGEFSAEGEGNSKKLSKKRAATTVLQELKKLPPLPVVEKPKLFFKKRPKTIVKVSMSLWALVLLCEYYGHDRRMFSHRAGV